MIGGAMRASAVWETHRGVVPRSSTDRLPEFPFCQHAVESSWRLQMSEAVLRKAGSALSPLERLEMSSVAQGV